MALIPLQSYEFLRPCADVAASGAVKGCIIPENFVLKSLLCFHNPDVPRPLSGQGRLDAKCDSYSIYIMCPATPGTMMHITNLAKVAAGEQKTCCA